MNLISLILRHAIHKANAIALKSQDEILTYSELIQRACRLRSYLSDNCVKGQNVGIHLKYSSKVVITVLAAILSEVIFVPIDPDYPLERIEYILDNTNISLLITETSLINNLAMNNINTINFDKISENDSKNSSSLDCFCFDTQTKSPVYILYTSGSTGTPKGVVINQKGLLDTYQDWEKEYNLKSNDLHLQMASFSFDVFYGDLLRALCSGSTLVLCPRNVLLKPKLLYELIEKEKITVAEFVPAILRNLANYLIVNNKCLASLRLLICGSDNWSIGEYKKFKSICGNATRVINSYGLTEATIDSCYFEMTPDLEEKFSENESVPIGQPFGGTNVYLLDENLNPVISGEIGEIYLSGTSLADCYFNNPLITKSRFIEVQLEEQVVRLLKTGDLARFVAGNNLQLTGRVDNQIKLNGRRVDVIEIENNLNQHPQVIESVIALEMKENGKCYLIAYIVAKDSRELIQSEFKDFLKKKLPYYMVPKTFIKIDTLPLTPNGKLDRNEAWINSTTLLKGT